MPGVTQGPPGRAILRIVLIIVGVVLALYLLYLLRRPLSWLFIAGFIAIALSGPVNWLTRRVKRRGLAIAITYLTLLAIPITLAALIVPPIVNQGVDLAQNAPEYAQDVTNFIQDNKRLRDLNEKYDVTEKLEQEAGKLPDKIGDAAGVLRDVGFGLINSIFALVTILILSIFMVANGPRWRRSLLRLQPPARRERINRVLDRSSQAVGGYVAGALGQAALAAVLTYFVLLILGVPFRAPLAVLVFVADLIPLVGATIGAVIVGIVTVFVDFPTTTIIWTVWAIVYQQVENNVIQPRIQSRAIDVQPFIVVVAILFGATLFGIIGALVALPVAASIQIAMREYYDYRGREWPGEAQDEPPGPDDKPEKPPPGSPEPGTTPA
jgi:predicted PurR-regulated permease PerM